MRKILSDLITNLGFYLLSSSFGEGYHILTKREADNLYTNYRSRFFQFDGLRIHYRIEGEGFPIVLLHGFSASLHLWEDWTERLSQNYQVIRLDIPGFGLSDLPTKNNIHIDYYVQCLEHLLKYLNITNCYLAGNSFGGWISWEFSLRQPDIVEKLILVSAAGYFTTQTKPKTVEYMKKPVFKQILKSGIPRFVIKRLLANSYGDKNRISEFDINRYYGLANREGNLLSMVKIATSPISARPKNIRKITHPTLIMWGTLDRIIPVTDAFKFNKDIKNSKLLIYKGVGHIPQVEIPEKTLSDLLAFLEREEE